MLIVTIYRSDYIMPLSFHICDKIIEKENELILHMDTTITNIKEYSYYSVMDTNNEDDEQTLVELFKNFDKQVEGLKV